MWRLSFMAPHIYDNIFIYIFTYSYIVKVALTSARCDTVFHIADDDDGVCETQCHNVRK